MNESNGGVLAAMGNIRFSDEDDARRRYLDETIGLGRLESKTGRPPQGELCKRGHNDWGTKQNGKYLARYCKTCNAEREDARRNRR